MSPDRISMPDIDSDIQDDRREEVINYVREKYGYDHVSRIVTFITNAARASVRMIARIQDKPVSLGDKIAKTIPNKPKMTLKKAFGESPAFAQLYEEDAECKEIIDLAMMLEGLKTAVGIHACFDKDTMVRTKDGYKQISSIKTNESVLTHLGDYSITGKLFKNKSDEQLKILAQNSLPIISTNNHPFLVKTITRKKKGIYRKLSEETFWIEAKDLIPHQHYLGIPINKKENPIHFENFNGYDFWWLIGRFLGDGWREKHYHKDTNWNEKDIIICCGKNKQNDIDEIKKHLDRINIEYRLSNSRTTHKFYLKCKDLYDWLDMFGEFADGKRIPGCILDMPVDNCKALLDGYLSADGYFNTKTGAYSFKTVSKELFYGIIELVNKVYRVPCSDIYVQKAGTDIIEGRAVNRKEKYSASFIPERRLRSRYFVENGFIWVPVLKKEKIAENKNVYNLGVYDINSYTVGTFAVHNCGVLITPTPVVDFMPQVMIKDKDTGEYIATTQLTMTECEDAGCLKMDFLGLRNLGVIAEEIEDINTKPRAIQRALEMIEKDPQKDRISPKTMQMLKDGHVEFGDIPRNDLRVYDFMSKGNTQGVFQYESPYMRDLCQKLLQDIDANADLDGDGCFNRLSDGSALGRPGPMAEIPHYVDSMLHPEKIHYEVDAMKEFLSSTYGVIVYQEQAMTMVRKLAGFSAGQADLIRKGMAYR